MEAQEALDLLTLAQVETNIDNISAAIAFGLNPPFKKSAVSYLRTSPVFAGKTLKGTLLPFPFRDCDWILL